MQDKIKNKKTFLRQNYFRHKRLGMKWRRPRGKQSKMRKSKKGKASMPGIGYKAAEDVRGFVHGFKPVTISNPDDLKKIGKHEIAVVSSGVGLKKISEISEKARELGVKIHNTRRVKKSLRHAAKIEKMKQAKKTEAKKAAEEKREKKEHTEIKKEA